MRVNKDDCYEYVRGTNEILDRIYTVEDGPVFIINGSIGRRPIMAASLDEAIKQYKKTKRTVLNDSP